VAHRLGGADQVKYCTGGPARWTASAALVPARVVDRQQSDRGGVLGWSRQPRASRGTSPSFGYSTGVFHLRVMSRHARPHRLGPMTGPTAIKETGAMRTVVGRRLRDVDGG
jgi:hypothetical protein